MGSEKKSAKEFLRYPMLIVNFKTYKEATGEKAEELALICDEIAENTNENIVVAVQPGDIYRVSRKVKNIAVIGQHFDAIDYGHNTGFVLAQDIRENGAIGSILNHSEHRLEVDVIEKSIGIAKKNDMITVVCSTNSEIAESIAVFSPDIIAVEPPELIAGNTSVSQAEPSIITDTIDRVKKIKNLPVLCGAGIKTYDDVLKALQLGAEGVLVASAITKSDNPRQVIESMVRAFKDYKESNDK